MYIFYIANFTQKEIPQAIRSLLFNILLKISSIQFQKQLAVNRFATNG